MEKNRLSGQEELRLWKECLFTFDSSAMLNFYAYSQATRQNVVQRILMKLTGRLWVSDQVWAEFLRNRRMTLKKPIAQYELLLNRSYKELRNKFEDIKNQTKGDDKHPFIDPNVFNEVDVAFYALDSSFQNAINQKIKEINDFENNDTVYEDFSNILKRGNSYSYETLLDIVKEGEFRFRYKIPPGYCDEGGKGKLAFQIFGDLIVWKQIIDKAKESRKPIVLINDDEKEDWWSKSERKIIAPREELIKEIQDVAGVKFWMYSSSMFIERANEILEAHLDTQTIRDVQDTLTPGTEKPDWGVILLRKDIISISGYQYAPCSHPELSYVTNVTWNYLDYKLFITSVNNPEIEIDPKETFNLQSYNYILLNPHIAEQRWLFRLSIVAKKLRLDLIFSPLNSHIEIIDQQ